MSEPATPTEVTTGTLNILGQTWTVKLMHLDGGEYGVTYPDKSEIHINVSKDPATYHDTLLHEILHAIEGLLRLDMKENQVSRLATGLRAFFVTNPQVAAWLVK